MVLWRKEERDIVGMLGSCWSSQHNETVGDWYRRIKLEDRGECNDVRIGRADLHVIRSRKGVDQTEAKDGEAEGIRIAVGAEEGREIISIILEAGDSFLPHS